MTSAKGLILVVEDELAVQKLVRRRAEREGLELLFAQTNEEGFALATTSNPALILIDLHLPDGCGLALLARLKADVRTAHIGVLVWSGSGVAEDEDEAIRAGAMAFFEKSEVRSVVEKIVELLDPSTR